MYQTLSDLHLQDRYNEFGSEGSAPENGFLDPEEVFGIILSRERFLPLIGWLSFSRDMKTALQGPDTTKQDAATPFQRKFRDEQRGAEVCLHCGHHSVTVDWAALCRSQWHGRPACRSLSRICTTSLTFSQRMPLAQLTLT